MVTPLAWKVDRTMAVWGIAFGFLATISGMLLLGAIEGGFLAEGVFLLVLSWVLALVLVARVVTWIREREQRPQ
jgi:hypothetical protein